MVIRPAGTVKPKIFRIEAHPRRERRFIGARPRESFKTAWRERTLGRMGMSSDNRLILMASSTSLPPRSRRLQTVPTSPVV
jgi:hypothetical protein